MQIWDLHLNNPECRGVEIGDDYVFTIKTNLTDCGTIMVIIFSVNIPFILYDRRNFFPKESCERAIFSRLMSIHIYNIDTVVWVF